MDLLCPQHTHLLPLPVCRMEDGTLRKTVSGHQMVCLFRDVLLAIYALHDMGMSHNDIKPANIMASFSEEDGGQMIVQVSDTEPTGLGEHISSTEALDMAEVVLAITGGGG